MINKIQPITISYVAGSPKTAEYFQIYSSYDGLDVAANLQWSLMEKAIDSEGNEYAGATIQSGVLDISGQDYQDWSTEPDANTWVIDWAAQQLNITLIPA